MMFLKFQILFMVNYLFSETKGPFTKGLGKNDTCKLYMQLWTQLGPGNVTSQQFSNMVYIVTIHAAVSVHIMVWVLPRKCLHDDVMLIIMRFMH